MPRLSHNENLFGDIQLLKIEEIHSYMVGLWVRKSLGSDMFAPVEDSGHNLRGRQSADLVIPFATSDHSQQSIKINGPKVYNSIPAVIRNCETYPTFKSSLKKYLLGNRQ